MSCPLPFYSLFLLMMDSCRRCKCDAHTQWNLPCLCFHLHLFSLVFLHVAVCVGKKWGDAHTACPSSHVCCVHWKRVGDVFLFFFSSREISNPMNTVFPLLRATQSCSPHSSMDILYFFIEKRVQMFRMGFTISVICSKCV